ncbi:single-stranded-DNA-specific exonuclease RecJ [Variibacter gotjawalensis]|uniref:Single-stranded-DNA-specific exonuclease RecJ n=1 Tax=Variibacter gotjawalensis TaxID=1333996 RepID=A0A0S3PWS9_9BRAD|nr:single-stranded-DNA-specific exonuclease RecJ [Variibacter gotjawalensis]NIK46209.1 single-stranded-DNA-specific exonuclease [Variibacter gotjawalensis]RZS48126.1 exonuclease RecJ [Variibacter gotjawalensis]BAT60383.1 single-stranded-DNA-specific exonuclease RecJ [Variibacter gotjawalensis]
MTSERIPAFLGVTQSLTGRLWRDRLDARGQAAAIAIGQRLGSGDLLARVLAGRGVGADEAGLYLNPSLRDLLPDPDCITDMGAATARLADAILAHEQIAIFGDYDVDGATSAALLTRFLSHCGLDPFIHIPDRIFEGYGPNIEAIRALRDRGAKLLVTVDCGTTSIEVLAEAAKLGLQTVVIDHHQVGEQLPAVAAIVNPNRQDCLSGLGHLAAVGLVFVTLVALNRELRQRGFWTTTRPEPNLLDWLDLVALGTVADVAPLTGLNRAFVQKGLIAMRRRDSIGLTALMDASRLTGPPEPWHLGFMLGPRINAGGRIGRAERGVELLLEKDPTRAAARAAELDRLNTERRAIELETLAEAEAEALAALGLEERGAVVVAAGNGWHPGVVGLVAARLKERYGRPAFAITFDENGIGTGSGRSILGVDLGTSVRAAMTSGILMKGGGHAMAAGITLRREALGDFRAHLEGALANAVDAARQNDALLVDGALSAAAANSELIASIASAGPFGSGNPEPMLVFPRHTLAFAEEVGGAHVRARFRSPDGAFLQAVAFRAVGQDLGRALLERRGQTVHVAGTLSVDRWQGAERVQLRIVDVASAESGRASQPLAQPR